LTEAASLFTVLTGPTSGIYFPIGGAYSTLISNLGYKSSATATGASGENINSLLTGQGELAIAMGDAITQAYTATGAFEGKEPAKDLRVMCALWPNVCQIVTTTDSGIKTFEDLKGKRVGVGAPNSGVELNARALFEAYGMTYDDCKTDYLAYGEAIQGIINGTCDVAFVTSGLGNATIKELGATSNKEIYFVPVDGEARKNLIAKYPYFMETVIPKDTYETAVDTETAAVMNMMLVSKDLSDDIVYDLTKGIFDNIATVQASHATAKKYCTLENALTAVSGLPMHPGAERYYKELGMLK
jgi:TRAP transporter TAXI family solute receptor